ncbi:MAG: exodeoxyribonuclease V subunit alpha [Acidimicrobiales bacterium]
MTTFAPAVAGPDESPFAGLDTADASLMVSLPAGSLLRAFNQAGVLVAADLHVATRLGRLGGDEDESVALATAFAVRAPRVGHVRVDLANIAATAAADIADEVDVTSLPWPVTEEWIGRLAGSPLVAVGEDDPTTRPLRLVGEALYLDRYWQDERAVASDLSARSVATRPVVDLSLLSEGLGRLFPGERSQAQRWAAAAAALGRLAVVAGGPGTGKTTTVARLIALLVEQSEASGMPHPLIGLAAPTGKAANRMEEAVRAEAESMQISGGTKEHLRTVRATTIHRLLAPHPGSSSRFRHDRGNRLPHDVIVVDETSMVALSLMARLLEAVRPEARLLLVGDPEQLASVEAGAVLADIVGPAGEGLRMRPAARKAIGAVTGREPPVAPAGQCPLGDGVVILQANHRFRGALAALAGAVKAGDADEVVNVLRSGDPAIRWVEAEAAPAASAAAEPLREAAVAAGQEVFAAALAGEAAGALDRLGRFRLLCAHRRGPAGVAAWNPVVEAWMSEAGGGFSAADSWYIGRPVVLTANDYGLRLYNGDAGVVVSKPDRTAGVAFHREGTLALVSPSRLGRADTAWVMTVHKAQGSEFEEVALLLPEPVSRILTRELLYTALTRARQRVILVGSEESLRAAVNRRVARASGLAARLWPMPGDG